MTCEVICQYLADGSIRILALSTYRETIMNEAQIDALVHFVRREAEFAEMRARGQNPSPRDVKESENEFREALRDER